MDELQTLELSITEPEEATAEATAGAIEAEDPQHISKKVTSPIITFLLEPKQLHPTCMNF